MADIHRIVVAIGEDPQLLQQLVAACDPIERRNILQARGLLVPGEPGPTAADINADISAVLAPGSPMIGSLPPVGLEKPVEWVVAIATGAAGALAAACMSET